MTSGESRPGDLLGAQLGNYRILDQLGEGGMGIVYLGRHEALGHRVAVKVLQHELSRNAEMVRRFFNEAQAASAIRSPGIVQVFDFGTTADGRAYFVMELLEGQSLAARLRQRRLDEAECCRLGRQITNVLNAAHSAGITHRDLKPDNLFLVPDSEVIGGERVKVLDFGIAKMLDHGGRSLADDGHATVVKTHIGMMLGTPQYMSPEQCRGAGMIDTRSDIYSLGCILFEMVCGRPPFLGEGAGEIMGAHQYVEPPAPRSLAPGVSDPLASLIVQMLAKRPEARPQTMTIVGQALEEILRMIEGIPVSGPRSGPMSAPMNVPSQPLQYPVVDRALVSTTLGGSVGQTNPRARTRTGRPRRAPLVIGGLAAVLAIATVAVIQSSNDPEPGAGSTEEPEGRKLEVECVHAQYNQAWPELATCADRLQAFNPELAKDLQSRATLELAAMPRIAAFEAALRDKNLKQAKAELDALAKDVTRFGKLERSYGEAEEAAVQDLATRLEAARSSDCKAHQQLVEEERASRPPRVTDEAVRQVPCTPAGSAQTAQPQPMQSTQAPQSKPTQLAQPSQTTQTALDEDDLLRPQAQPKQQLAGCDSAALAEKGKERYESGLLAAALASYEAAWACKPAPVFAEKAFVIACNLPNAGKAKLFWKRMPVPSRQRALMICVRNGISEDRLNAP